jgi:hypothetical protein
VKLRAQAVYDRNNGNGNPGGDQTVFDGVAPDSFRRKAVSFANMSNLSACRPEVTVKPTPSN